MQFNRGCMVQNRRHSTRSTTLQVDFKERHTHHHEHRCQTCCFHGAVGGSKLSPISARGQQAGETLHLCSSRWDPPARRRRSPGSLHPARAAVSLPGSAQSHRLDHVALVCVGRTNTNKRQRWGKITSVWRYCRSTSHCNQILSQTDRIEKPHWRRNPGQQHRIMQVSSTLREMRRQ